MPSYSHIPVLLSEVLSALAPASGLNFVDATLGGAGYTRKLLESTSPTGKVLSIDLDVAAIANAEALLGSFGKRLILYTGNFKDISRIVTHKKFLPINGIVADLGFSSYQLEAAGLGISFQRDEPLDMRFAGPHQIQDAKFFINRAPIDELVSVFTEFGEERYSKSIAKAIIRARGSGEIRTTYQLKDAIVEGLPKPVRYKAIDSYRRIFQAVRIRINNELENLKTFLPEAFNILAPGGRLAIITFHSLEDRIVKQYFTQLQQGCICPPDFPECVCGKLAVAKTISKKPITATQAELDLNSRAASAKLRAIIKL